MKQYEVIGVIITLLGAVLWGVSGASVQFLSNFRDMNLEWLVTMRLITAGLLTVIYAWFRFGNSIFNVFHSVKIMIINKLSKYSTTYFMLIFAVSFRKFGLKEEVGF